MDDPSPNRGLMIVLAYLWPLAIVPLLMEKQDAEVRWHAKHGLVLMGAELAGFAGLTVIITVLSFTTLVLGCALSLVVIFLWVAVLLVHVVAMIKGLNGGRLTIPGITHLASRF
jgi:uncharacterized membrane protein